nr:MAG TPA: hypothetical protein [Caudoviricetes sp.]
MLLIIKYYIKGRSSSKISTIIQLKSIDKTCVCYYYINKHTFTKEKGAVHTNEEKYKEEIIKFIKEEKDEVYLRAVYTFAKNYPRSKKEEKE